MKWILPEPEELSSLRPDPLLWEQELDVRPGVAEALEHAAGKRAGKVFWRSGHDHLYALELADLGEGRPSMARVFGYWDRWEPRPPEHEIDADLLAFSLWVAEIGGIGPEHVRKVAQHAGIRPGWPEGSVLRTPEERFADLPDFPYPAKYVEVEGLRMAYVEEGAGDAILMLHGAPAWGYLYRRMIPPLARTGRVVVPDLIGFGRSDKPRAANAHTCRSHARWLRKFILALDLDRITLVCQDCDAWLGLRVLADMPERFARVAVMNSGIPGAEGAAYHTPFPDREYQTGALVFPRLAPKHPDDPGAYEHRLATEKLRELKLPALLVWSEEDPSTRSGEELLRGIFRHAAPTVWIRGTGNSLPEDDGEEVAAHLLRWIEADRNP